jgi:integrase
MRWGWRSIRDSGYRRLTFDNEEDNMAILRRHHLPQFWKKLVDAAMAQRNKSKGIRDVAIIRFLSDLHLGSGEIVELEMADVDCKTWIVTIPEKAKGKLGKNEGPQPLQLYGEMKAALIAWLAVRGIHPGPLFRNFDPAKKGSAGMTRTAIYQLITGLAKKIGKSISPIDLKLGGDKELWILARERGSGIHEVLRQTRHATVRPWMIDLDRQNVPDPNLPALR